MITIQGLTPKQKALLTVMWEIDSMDKVKQFIGTLPQRDQQDAHSLVQMAIWESQEQQGELDAYSQAAADCIRAARGL
jgi:putative IMPACT (imprinted ancient) family translation regulator